MKVDDLNKVAQIEKAIAKKYGKEAIANPKSFWTDEKEKEYLQSRVESETSRSRHSFGIGINSAKNPFAWYSAQGVLGPISGIGVIDKDLNIGIGIGISL